MKAILKHWPVNILIILVLMLTACDNTPPSTLRIMLDSGHSYKQPGALGARGQFEKQYNDLLVKDILQLAQNESGLTFITSGLNPETATLEQRVAFINEQSVDVLISIHHNSVSEHLIERSLYEGKVAANAVRDYQGYGIFISQQNSRLTKSLLFATALGNAMRTIDRFPYISKRSKSPEHNLMNRQLGIYQFDSLAVLRGVKIPAVLFEVGFIVDQKDEAYVRENREAIALQILAALKTYRDQMKNI